MTAHIIKLRSPVPPHIDRAAFLPAGLNYGFGLMESTSVSLNVSRADVNHPEDFGWGDMVSIERAEDDYHRWFGFIMERVFDDESGVAALVIEEHMSAILEGARTANDWPEQRTSAGNHMRRIFAEADRRAQRSVAEPRLIIDYPTSQGLDIAYTPTAEPISSFIKTMTETGWEWRIDHGGASTGWKAIMRWQERIGHDHREFSFEQGHHFTRARLTQRARERVGSALAVGGTGTFRNRPSATAPTAGPAAPSPALARSRVIIEPQVTNTEALQAMARRAHHASDHVAESLEFVLWEGTNAAGLTSVPVELLEVGGLYRIRFADLVLGLGLERDIRILAFSFQEDESVSGAISVAAEVWRETATP